MEKLIKLSPVAVGFAIKTLREEAKMSANELATAIGMAPSSLSRVENGYRQLDFGEAVLAAGAMGAKVDDLARVAMHAESSGYVKQRDEAQAELRRSMALVKDAAAQVLSELQKAEDAEKGAAKGSRR